METPARRDIHPGANVSIVEKQNQRTGILTEGTVERILTHSYTHPHGIKVMLTNGKVGRVQSLAAGKPVSPKTATISKLSKLTTIFSFIKRQ